MSLIWDAGVWLNALPFPLNVIIWWLGFKSMDRLHKLTFTAYRSYRAQARQTRQTLDAHDFLLYAGRVRGEADDAGERHSPASLAGAYGGGGASGAGGWPPSSLRDYGAVQRPPRPETTRGRGD